MAARRLMIVLMALIAVSMAITVIAQPLRGRFGPGATSTRPTTTSVEKTTQEEAEVMPPETRELSAAFRPGGRNRIEVSIGDQLALFVKVARPQQVLIPALGLTSYADPYAPARFDILWRNKGTFQVRSSMDEKLGTIIVSSDKRK